jgi:hypothetical protein
MYEKCRDESMIPIKKRCSIGERYFDGSIAEKTVLPLGAGEI